MYAPHAERSIYPAPLPTTTVKPADDTGPPPLDDFGLLVRSQPLPLPAARPQPQPQPQQQQAAPAPAPVLPPGFPLVSDDYTADFELAQQLMQSDEENLQAAALDSLRLEDVVPARAHPGVKYAYAPSRARRGGHQSSRGGPSGRNSNSPSSFSSSTHSSPATSSSASRGFSLPLPAVDELKPLPNNNNNEAVGPPLRTSQSHPVLLTQPPHPLRGHFSDEQIKRELIEEPSTSPAPSAPSVASSAPLPAVPPPPPPPPPQPAPADAPQPPSKRPARPTKRSPAPRRQECKMCGKKFQRPCQLTTHIRSHTGEQPHACPVCSRRFSVLSNCQRHVKLCQKRSAKVISPGDEDAGTDSTAGPSSSSFITYPPEPTEDSSRRSNEVPIRPKPASSHGSGSSLAGVGPAALERSASVGSSGVMEGEGVVKSEPLGYSYSAGYEQASGSGSGFGYDESGSTYEPVRAQFEPQQTIYEEPASEYPPSGSSFGAAGSEFDAARANGGYEPSTSGAYNHPGSGYDALGSGQYGSSDSGYGQPGPTFDQAASSGAEYGQQGATEYAHSYSDYSHPSPSHIHPHPSPSHVQIQPLPSPSHVHASSPSVYSTPSMLGTPTMHTVPSMRPDSTYLSPTTSGPGMSISRSVPSMTSHATVPVSRRASASVARRSTLSAMNAHDALGFTAETMPRRQTIVSSDSVAQPFVFGRSPASLVNRALEPEVKHENEEGGDVWTQTQAFPSAHPGGYHQPWSDSASGAGGFHQYGPDPGTSASTATEQHQSIANGYSYPQQPQPQLQQQLYGQQPAGFTPQHMTEQSPDGYSTAYANPSSSYPGPLEPEVGVKHYSGYSWAGAGSPWNGQPGYNS